MAAAKSSLDKLSNQSFASSKRTVWAPPLGVQTTGTVPASVSARAAAFSPAFPSIPP